MKSRSGQDSMNGANRQQGRHKRSSWGFRLALSLLVLITLVVIGVIIWLLKTQDLDKLSTKLGILASIVTALIGLPTLFFTIVKWPDSEEPTERNRMSPPLQHPRHAEYFQDRVGERTWLLAQLHPGRIVTICGPGGMGKTALVSEVLWTLAPGDTPPASFPDGIVFHSFYGQPETAVVLEQLARTFGEDPLPTPAQAARRALGGKRVLLVLDGAEEAENLEQVLAVCASCCVLVTSRRRSDAADPALLLDLQRLPPEEAVAVVQAWQAQRQANDAVIARICQLVGGLPLALRLAGSYLALHPNEAGEYLAWLEEDLWEALDQGSSAHKSVPVLLERSLARLSSAAQAVLGVIGVFALAPIERELVTGMLNWAVHDASRALEELVDYGLLVRVGRSYEVSHPLIHAYARQRLLKKADVARQRALLVQLVTVLIAHFPNKVTHTTWGECERLLPHIQACALQLAQQGEALADAAALFFQAGIYSKERARYVQAEELFKRALLIREQVLEPDHFEIAESLDRLARIYRSQGKYKQAEPLFQRSLAIEEKTLGPEHPDTATTLSNLAVLYREQGKYKQAEPLFQRSLAIKEKTLGPEHPYTATTLDNLAMLYREQGKYKQAEPLYQRALTIREKTLGPEHPYIATTLANYADLLRQMQRTEEAIPFEQRAQAIRAKRSSVKETG